MWVAAGFHTYMRGTHVSPPYSLFVLCLYLICTWYMQRNNETSVPTYWISSLLSGKHCSLSEEGHPSVHPASFACWSTMYEKKCDCCCFKVVVLIGQNGLILVGLAFKFRYSGLSDSSAPLVCECRVKWNSWSFRGTKLRVTVLSFKFCLVQDPSVT